MQQTDKYKLNKPGVDDPIAIAPLNENADKIEAALLAKADAADVTDLNQRLQVFEAKKFVVGTYYIAMNQTVNIQIGFTPTALYVSQVRRFGGAHALILPDDTNISPFLQIVEGGFTSNIVDGSTGHPGTYHYIALG